MACAAAVLVWLRQLPLPPQAFVGARHEFSTDESVSLLARMPLAERLVCGRIDLFSEFSQLFIANRCVKVLPAAGHDTLPPVVLSIPWHTVGALIVSYRRARKPMTDAYSTSLIYGSYAVERSNRGVVTEPGSTDARIPGRLELV